LRKVLLLKTSETGRLARQQQRTYRRKLTHLYGYREGKDVRNTQSTLTETTDNITSRETKPSIEGSLRSRSAQDHLEDVFVWNEENYIILVGEENCWEGSYRPYKDTLTNQDALRYASERVSILLSERKTVTIWVNKELYLCYRDFTEETNVKMLQNLNRTALKTLQTWEKTGRVRIKENILEIYRETAEQKLNQVRRTWGRSRKRHFDAENLRRATWRENYLDDTQLRCSAKDIRKYGKETKTRIIYTDGSSVGNSQNHASAWSWYENESKQASGQVGSNFQKRLGLKHEYNFGTGVMTAEFQGVWEAVLAYTGKEPCIVVTDCASIEQAFLQESLDKTKLACNAEFVKTLKNEMLKRNITLARVKGHRDPEGHNKADALSRETAYLFLDTELALEDEKTREKTETLV